MVIVVVCCCWWWWWWFCCSMLFHLFQTNFICTGYIPLSRIQPKSQHVGLFQNLLFIYNFVLSHAWVVPHRHHIDLHVAVFAAFCYAYFYLFIIFMSSHFAEVAFIKCFINCLLGLHPCGAWVRCRAMPSLLPYRGFTFTLRHTTVGRTPLDEWSARRRDATFTTVIHAPGGTRTHTPSKRAAADPCLTPRGHWDRPLGLHTRSKFYLDLQFW